MRKSKDSCLLLITYADSLVEKAQGKITTMSLFILHDAALFIVEYIGYIKLRVFQALISCIDPFVDLCIKIDIQHNLHKYCVYHKEM